jgi:uncharacterized membrane protein
MRQRRRWPARDRSEGMLVNWLLFWLFLHIAAAIIAFGPSFVFPLMEPALKTRPAGLGFAMLLSEKMERGLIIPVALTMAVSGTGLIFSAGLNFLKNGWLLASIGLYVIALCIALLNQVPTTAKLVALTGETGPQGPPGDEILALLRRNKIGGIILAVLLLSIIFLMVVRPGGLA